MEQKIEINPLIYNNADFLRLLAKTKSIKKRRRLLKHANTSQLLSLAEICLNIVCSQFKLTTRQRKRLLPHASFIRQLARVRSERGAKKIIVQKGGGSASLFASILTPILIEIARNLIGKKEANGQQISTNS
jgi:hypothetical protein